MVARGAANRERVNDLGKKGGGRCMHITYHITCSKQHQSHGENKGWLVCCHHNLLQTELSAQEKLI